MREWLMLIITSDTDILRDIRIQYKTEGIGNMTMYSKKYFIIPFNMNF
jgi:hypothetical protein